MANTPIIDYSGETAYPGVYYWSGLLGQSSYREVTSTSSFQQVRNFLSASATMRVAISSSFGIEIERGANNGIIGTHNQNNALPGALGNDLIIVQGTGGTYIGHSADNYDTLFADWTTTVTDVTWANDPSASFQQVNSVTLSNFERLLVATGSGNDNVSNLLTNTDDYFETNAGNDVVSTGNGNDTVVAGSGVDFITVRPGQGVDSVDGGSGTDTLVMDFSGQLGYPGLVYWSGVQGQESYREVTSNSSFAQVQAFLAASTVVTLATTTAYGVVYENIENTTVTGTDNRNNVFPGALGNDLLVVQGTGGAYRGGSAENFDTLYADWSAATSDIAWANDPAAGDQAVNGLTLAGIERLLLATGSGNDNIANTLTSTDDWIDTGAGNDTISSGGGNDTVNAGSGNDRITVGTGSGRDIVDGGAGVDTLLLDFSGQAGGGGLFYWSGVQGEASYLEANSSNTFAQVRAFLAASPVVTIATQPSYGVTYQGIEVTSITGTDNRNNVLPGSLGNDLLIVQGSGGAYRGGSALDADTLFADWSAAAGDIAWANDPAAGDQAVNGVLVNGIERMMLATGSGNDAISNLATATDDYIDTGSGNDTVSSGGGNDTVLAGAGNDLITVGAGNGVDSVDGGAGTDTLLLDFSGRQGITGLFYFSGVLGEPGYREANAGNTFAQVRDFLAASPVVTIASQPSYGVTYAGIENTSVTGTDNQSNVLASALGNDLVIVQGTGGTYRGGSAANFDTLYADWSTSSSGIAWANDPSGGDQSVNGVVVSGFERLLLATGSGNDVISNLLADTDDSIDTGAGNDVVNAGAGSDTIFAGSGYDRIDGGSGSDTAVFSNNRAFYVIYATPVAGNFVVTDGGNAVLTTSIESLKFADTTLASSAVVAQADTAAPQATHAVAERSAGTTRVTVRFSEGIQAAAGTLQVRSSGGAVLETIDIAGGSAAVVGNLVVLTLSSDLAAVVGGTVTVANGTVTDWSGNAGVVSAATIERGASAVTQPADFAGDGKADLLWRNTSTGDDHLWRDGLQSQTSILARVSDLNWRVQAIADFTGDGKADLWWRNSSTGDNYLWRSGDAAQGQGMAPVPTDWQLTAHGDFAGDGKADILWRNTSTGEVHLWRDGLQSQTTVLASVPLAWRPVAWGDFTGDGKADIWWRNTTTGDNYVWRSGDPAQGQGMAPVPLDWSIVAAADFAGDGKADVLWRNSTTGENHLWRDGLQSQTSVLPTLATQWSVAAAVDTSGDGKADLLWRNAGNGANTLWLSADAAQAVTLAGIGDAAWQAQGPTGAVAATRRNAAADFAGDGKADLLWRNTSTGENHLWRDGLQSTTTILPTVADTNWTVAAIADFTGDGKSDIWWRNTSNGANYIWPSGDAATGSPMAGVPTDWTLAAYGDFAGDGKADILWRNTNTGEDHLWRDGLQSQTTVLATVATNWQPVAWGDFTGDGKADIWWRNSSNGDNYLWRSGDPAQGQGMAPVPLDWRIVAAGDFAGDGKADVIWRNSTTGENHLWRDGLQSTTTVLATVPTDWSVVAATDYTGDGKTDLLWRNSTGGQDFLWSAGDINSTIVLAPVADMNWRVQGPTGAAPPPATTTRVQLADFAGDGKADLLWRNGTTGENHLWRDGLQSQTTILASVPDTNWRIQTIADFTGDGKSDLWWRNTSTGDNVLWRSGDASQTQGMAPVGVGVWSLIGAADFSGDGKADALWRNTTTGEDHLWRDGLQSQTTILATVATAWRPLVVGDITGDGKADLWWRNETTGDNIVWRSGDPAQTQVMAPVGGNVWSIVAAADFSGDGKVDVLWRNSTTGENHLWRDGLQSQTTILATVATQWRPVAATDITGDGKADLLWRNETTGQDFLWPQADINQTVVLAPVGGSAWQVQGVGVFS